MQTCPCNVNPLTPHFYIAKLGFAGGILCFLIFALNIDCGYSLEPLTETVLTCTHNICFEQKYEKVKQIQLKNVIFTAVKNRCILHRRFFVMCSFLLGL